MITFWISVIATHPLVAESLVHILSCSPDLERLLLPPKMNFSPFPPRRKKYILVLDVVSLSVHLSKLARILRMRYPGSKLLVLVGPNEDDIEILRLLYNGIEGIVRIGDNLETKLPQAVRALLSGNLWAPNNVLAEYVHQTNLLFNQQFLSSLSLTGRESQVLQLVIRRMSNKEIAGALNISERTVRFHVSNIFTKFRVADRKSLLTAFEELRYEPT